MSDAGPEYTEVEKLFLEQLNALAWEVTDLGAGIPQDPATSDYLPQMSRGK